MTIFIAFTLQLNVDQICFFFLPMTQIKTKRMIQYCVNVEPMQLQCSYAFIHHSNLKLCFIIISVAAVPTIGP